MLKGIFVVGFVVSMSSFRISPRLYGQPLCHRLLGMRCMSSLKRVVFLGSPEVAAHTLQALFNASTTSTSSSSSSTTTSGFEIVRVVTQPPAPGSRKGVRVPTPVHVLAETLGIPVDCPEKANDVNFLETLEKLDVDLCITAAYGNYLPKRFLRTPKCGTVNIHPSLLPKYRGAAPVQRCLEQGDAETGVTVLYTESRMDAGPVIAQRQRVLRGDEKAPTVLRELFLDGVELLLSHLPAIFNKSAPLIIQAEEQASHAPKLSTAESVIDFSVLSASQVHNKVRAFSDWPGAWAGFRPQIKRSSTLRVKLVTTVVLSTATTSGTTAGSTSCNACIDEGVQGCREGEGGGGGGGGEVGSRVVEVVKLPNKVDMLKIRCHDGSELGILEVQPENKKVMDVKSFLNGFQRATLHWEKLSQT